MKVKEIIKKLKGFKIRKRELLEERKKLQEIEEWLLSHEKDGFDILADIPCGMDLEFLGIPWRNSQKF